jgi:Tfp pilus assembly protein PilX
MKRITKDPRGYALIMALVVTAVTAALVLGFISQVNTEQKIAQNDTDYNGAFYAAEAGLEKLNSDLSKLFASKLFPTQADIATIMAANHQPNLPGITFRQYSAFGGQTTQLNGALNATATTVTVDSTVDWPTAGFFMIDSEEFTYTGITSTTFTGVSRGQTGSTAAAHADNAGVSRSRVATLSEGDYSGLTAQMIPFNLEVTAQAGVGAETKLMREVQAALIPVFQFGMFSDSDLSFFAGPNFTFNGRIHTNGNLFLTQFAGTTLTLTDKVTAFQEVIRSLMPNGYSGLTGTVMLKSGTSTSRALAQSEESYVPGVLPPAAAPTGRWSGWTNLSLTTYNGYLKNGLTGARNLTLPFVAQGYANVELIRRPPAGEAVDSLMGLSRLANQASLRVFLSDTAAQLPGGTGYLLRNGLSGYGGTPFAEADPNDPDFITSAAGNAAGTLVVDETTNAPLIDGYILIQRQDSDGSWNDVTLEILNLGISQGDANAVLKFQKPRWDATGTTAANFVPINMFDTQQGRFRNGADSLSTTTRMRKLGIMNIVELDVARLRDWFAGTIGTTGSMAMSNNGYIFYFSDRRGNRDGSGNETAELGFEDTVNPASTTGDPNNSLDPGEDLNGNGTLDIYGANLPYSPYTASTDLYTTGVHASPPQKTFFLMSAVNTTTTSFPVASVNGLTVGLYKIDNEIVNCGGNEPDHLQPRRTWDDGCHPCGEYPGFESVRQSH